ncbi:MAG: hypothetical protein FWH52_00435 [Synergistaceae bacterium]|nr:hypothetical protein [Synergistaceae bacterium]
MVIEPLSLQLGNYGVGILAQSSKGALTQSQQTAQMNEIIKENEKKAQEIQPSDEIWAAEKIHRKSDEEHREDRKQGQEEKEEKQELSQTDEKEQGTTLGVAIQKNGRYDFYV